MPTPSRKHQQRARIFGVLFALTFVAAIAGLLRGSGSGGSRTG